MANKPASDRLKHRRRSSKIMTNRACFVLAALCLLTLLPRHGGAAERARDLGIPFEGTPGPLNAITDVPGVTVGHATIIEDYENGSAARAGVTAVMPRGND
jgi:D-aminopeptidase